MRKKLEIVGLAVLALLALITVRVFYGPTRLPDKVPVHFAFDGRVDAWGSSLSLLALPVIAVALYLLMTVVARYPGAFNYPVRVTPANRGRLELIALNMIAWLKVELVCVFVWIQHVTIEAARKGEGSISVWFMPVVLVVIFGTILWHFGMMRRASVQGHTSACNGGRVTASVLERPEADEQQKHGGDGKAAVDQIFRRLGLILVGCRSRSLITRGEVLHYLACLSQRTVTYDDGWSLVA